MRRIGRLVLVLVTLAACGRDEILHGLDEAQANQAMVALAEGGISAEKHRDEATEGAWRVDVPSGESPAAQRLLAERGLPRRGQAGFADVFGKGSIVPTPSEERALYLHALSGELARTVEAIDGVVEARVHLALPPQDPLRPDPAPPARAAVLVKARTGARARLEPLAPAIQSLVSGAVAGLDAASVAVVIAEATPGPSGDVARSRRRSALLGSAAALAVLAIVLPLAVASRRFALMRFRALVASIRGARSTS